MLGNLKIVLFCFECYVGILASLFVCQLHLNSLLMLFCQLGYFFSLFACLLVSLICICLLNVSSCFCGDKEPRYNAANNLEPFKRWRCCISEWYMEIWVWKISSIWNRIQMKDIIWREKLSPFYMESQNQNQPPLFSYLVNLLLLNCKDETVFLLIFSLQACKIRCMNDIFIVASANSCQTECLLDPKFVN